MGDHRIWAWILFHVFVALMLAIDMGLFHRTRHEVRLKEALIWTGVWVAMAMLFAGMLYFWSEELGLLASAPGGVKLSESRTAVDFITAYFIEESLSMDNVFVFLLIFRYFAIPAQFQHRALFWGILGALVLRLSFIFVGVTLLQHFQWLTYIFGAILLYTGVKMWRGEDVEVHPEHNPVLKLLKKIMPVQHDFAGGRFMVLREGRRYATPLLVALVVIETTDVVFAVDSVPAVLSITQDMFIAYTSNVFAIFGLRSLYFALAGVMPLFKDLHYGLSFILIFVGGEMIAEKIAHQTHWSGWPESMHWVSLGVVLATLVISMLTSVLRHKDEVTLDAESTLGSPKSPEPPRPGEFPPSAHN